MQDDVLYEEIEQDTPPGYVQYDAQGNPILDEEQEDSFEPGEEQGEPLEEQQPTQREAQQYISAKAESMTMQDRDEFVELVSRWRKEGYSAKEIALGVAAMADEGVKEFLKTRSSGTAQEPVQEEKPVFESADQEIEWMIEQRLKQALKPIQEQNEALKAKIQQREVAEVYTALQHENVNNFSEALSEFGVAMTDLKDVDNAALSAAIDEIYPGIDPSKTRFTKAQARTIVKRGIEIAAAYAQPSQVSAPKQSQQRRTQQQPPSIAGGKTLNGGRGASASVDFASMPKDKHQELLRSL